jgi:hypothetical protein
MKIKQILKKATPRAREIEIEKVNKMILPMELGVWVEGYHGVGGERNEFIWKWIYLISQIITISSVDKKYKRSLWEIKFLLIMFVVLLDDVSDKYKNRAILIELLKIPFNQDQINFKLFNEKDKDFINFTIKLWKHIESEYKKYPRYKEFREIIDFDIRQLLNAMEYAYLVNKDKHLINKEEYYTYLSHNMQLIIDVMFDLSCSLNFDSKELGLVREVSCYAQEMARIGNWISTWQREIGEDDFTSGVFAVALQRKIVNTEDLNSKNTDLVKIIQNSGIEDDFLMDWEVRYEKIEKFYSEIKTLNIKEFTGFLEKVIFAHLTSRGYK